MKTEFSTINKYAKEQGFQVFGNRYIRKDFAFELKCNLGYIEIYLNNRNLTSYRISNATECVNFCNILSSLIYLNFKEKL